MRDQRIAGRERASVSGLGVCDVWRLELTAEQWPWLIDERDEIRGPLEEELRRAWAQQAVDERAEAAQEVTAREYELRLVRMMREQLPAGGQGGGVVFVGPAELVRELVPGCPVERRGRVELVRSRSAAYGGQVARSACRVRCRCECVGANAHRLRRARGVQHRSESRSGVGALGQRTIATARYCNRARD